MTNAYAMAHTLVIPAQAGIQERILNPALETSALGFPPARE
jgi:hypothetical protein